MNQTKEVENVMQPVQPKSEIERITAADCHEERRRLITLTLAVAASMFLPSKAGALSIADLSTKDADAGVKIGRAHV